MDHAGSPTPGRDARDRIRHTQAHCSGPRGVGGMDPAGDRSDLWDENSNKPSIIATNQLDVLLPLEFEINPLIGAMTPTDIRTVDPTPFAHVPDRSDTRPSAQLGTGSHPRGGSGSKAVGSRGCRRRGGPSGRTERDPVQDQVSVGERVATTQKPVPDRAQIADHRPRSAPGSADRKSSADR